MKIELLKCSLWFISKIEPLIPKVIFMPREWKVGSNTAHCTRWQRSPQLFPKNPPAPSDRLPISYNLCLFNLSCRPSSDLNFVPHIDTKLSEVPICLDTAWRPGCLVMHMTGPARSPIFYCLSDFIWNLGKLWIAYVLFISAHYLAIFTCIPIMKTNFSWF